MRKRKRGPMLLSGAVLLTFTVLGCVVYSQRDHLLVYRHVDVVARDDDPAGRSARWLRERELLAVPVLASRLESADRGECRRVGSLIVRILAKHSDPTDPRDAHLAIALAANLRRSYGRLSTQGRLEAVGIAFRILRTHLLEWSPNVPTALATAGEVVLMSSNDANVSVRERALRSMPEIWSWKGSGGAAIAVVDEWKRAAYETGRALLRSPSSSIRSLAAIAVAGAPFHEGDQQLIGLLDDPDAQVSKTALLALRPVGDLTSEQKARIGEFLGDPDLEIREAATRLLLASGVRESVVYLFRQMKHPRATERAKVVSMVFAVPDPNFNPVPWIEKLARDPSPAVRLAVARAASESNVPELRATVERIAESDPDPNVRDLARQYLRIHLANRDDD